MLAVRPTLVLALVILLGACAGSRPLERSGSPRGARAASSLFVYLDPPPRELDGLRWRVASMKARAEDGALVDLDVRMETVGDGAERRQRLLATGALAPGRYVGLELAVARATIEREGAVRSIDVAAAPGMIDVPFDVGPREAVMLAARIAPGALVEERRFAPQISAGPPGDLADDAVAIASVPDDDVLVVFHKVTGEVFDVVKTCRGPAGVAYDAVSRRAYVACEADDAVEVLDLLRGRREQSLPLSFGDGPRGLALSRGGATLAVANAGSSTVVFLSAPRLAIGPRIDVPREPVAIVPLPDTERMAIFSREGNAITIVDADRARAVATVPTEEPGPVHGAVDPSADRLFVVHERSPYLSVVDLGELRVETRAYIGSGGRAVAVDRRTGRVYVGRSSAGAVEIYDPASLLPIDRLPGNGDGARMVVDPRGDRLYVGYAPAAEVRSFRLPGGDRAARTDVPAAVGWIAVAGQDGAR